MKIPIARSGRLGGTLLRGVCASLATLLLAALLPTSVFAQADGGFRYDIPDPAFDSNEGPTICFDAGHHNFHPADGAYAPFAQLVRDDGFEVRILRDSFTESALNDCALLVVTTPTHPSNLEDWSFPHPSAFSADEIRAVFRWSHAGGGLLLVVDHSPIPGAVADLAAVFGVALFDGEARNSTRHSLPDLFTRADRTLLGHPITEGRTEAERVSQVATWTGAAFMASREFLPLMVYGPQSRAWAELPETLPELPRAEYPVFEIEGWWASAARDVGAGRFVILGETAMCTAQRNDRQPSGMNTLAGAENPRFCLNAVRWLAGVLP